MARSVADAAANQIRLKPMEPLIKNTDVVKMLGVSKATLARKHNPDSDYFDATFPLPVRDGNGRNLGWRRVDLERWLAQQSGAPVPDSTATIAGIKDQIADTELLADAVAAKVIDALRANGETDKGREPSVARITLEPFHFVAVGDAAPEGKPFTISTANSGQPTVVAYLNHAQQDALAKAVSGHSGDARSEAAARWVTPILIDGLISKKDEHVTMLQEIAHAAMRAIAEQGHQKAQLAALRSTLSQ